jgi:hypothetical protein
VLKDSDNLGFCKSCLFHDEQLSLKLTLLSNFRLSAIQGYYPFGMLQPERQWSLGDYRCGFNGNENDNEVKGEGNQQDYGSGYMIRDWQGFSVQTR